MRVVRWSSETRLASATSERVNAQSRCGIQRIKKPALTWIEDRPERAVETAARSDSTHTPYKKQDPAVAGQKKWRLFAVCYRNRVGCVLTANKRLHGSNGMGPRTPPPGADPGSFVLFHITDVLGVLTFD